LRVIKRRGSCAGCGACLEDELVLADLDGVLLADLVVLGDVCEKRKERRKSEEREREVDRVRRRRRGRGVWDWGERVPFWILLRALACTSRSFCISRTAAGADDDAMACLLPPPPPPASGSGSRK